MPACDSGQSSFADDDFPVFADEDFVVFAEAGATSIPWSASRPRSTRGHQTMTAITSVARAINANHVDLRMSQCLPYGESCGAARGMPAAHRAQHEGQDEPRRRGGGRHMERQRHLEEDVAG